MQAVFMWAGYFWSDFHFNGTVTGTTSLGGSDVFVLKMAPDGSMTWFDRIGNSFANGNLLTESAARLALNGGDLFLLGNSAQGTTDMDPGTGVHNINLADPNAYVLKLDTDGDFQEEFHYDSDDQGSHGSDIAIDSDGNIIVTGNFTGTVDFDPSSDSDEMTSVGSLNAVNAFICKHISDGGADLETTIQSNRTEQRLWRQPAHRQQWRCLHQWHVPGVA
ncbi:MAG: hypothetical protein WDO15_23615 [Bacteroidota bacterium]